MKEKKHKQNTSILFVNPCLRKDAYIKLLPIGLASIMTYFFDNGYRFDLLDVDLDEFDDEYVTNYLNTSKYDFILVGSIVTHYKWIKWLVNTAKTSQPEATIIVGNSVAGSIPETFLKKTAADVVVIGEGEISALEAVDAIRMGRDLREVDGIAIRDNDNQIIITNKRKTGNINDLPDINWSFFDVTRYLDAGVKSGKHSPGIGIPPVKAMPIPTARGCAFKCTFCHYVFWNDPYRYRSPDRVINDIAINIEKYGIEYFNFFDDLSFASIPQVERMIEAILDSGLKFNWSASIRVDLLGKEKISRGRAVDIAKKMKKSGCATVGFSLESGNNEILQMMDKKIAPGDFIRTVEVCREADIVINTSVVFGYPIETKKTIQETFDQCLQAKVYPSIGFLLPLPDTGMYNYAVENGYITDEDEYLLSITERQDICVNMTTLSNDEILSEIKTGAKKLNKELELSLSDNRLIKTGADHREEGKSKKHNRNDEGILTRKENDLSLSYTEAEFDLETGL